MSIIKDDKVFNKFCTRLNKMYGCKEAFGFKGQCITCPLWVAREVDWLMTNKRMTLGEAVRATTRESITAEDALKIIGAYMLRKKEYPDGRYNKGREGSTGGRKNTATKARDRNKNPRDGSTVEAGQG